MKPNALKDKSLEFAIQVVNTCRKIQSREKEYILTKQLIRSGTAIGALYREAQHAESKLDFIHKLAIAQKECNESIYWLELMAKTEILDGYLYSSFEKSADELMSLITRIIKTTKSRI
jgi:four helix bundle protein